MNRIDRLFAILLQMQRRKRIRSEDLAKQFGISKRTVYRDISALIEMGVPIISLPGEGYELESGYYLPPLLFTPDEAQAVFLGTQMLHQQAKGRFLKDAEDAMAKIFQVVPPQAKRRVEQITAVIQFYSQEQRFDLEDEKITQLVTAVQEQQLINIQYFSYNREAWTEREIEPESITYSGDSWYVNGYCRLREAPRSFRVERIGNLRLLNEKFKPRHLPPPLQEEIEVQIQFDAQIVRWVRERQHYGFVKETAVVNSEDLIFHYAVHNLKEIIPWLLGWGEHAEPIEPESLRNELIEKIKLMSEKLTSGCHSIAVKC